MEALLNITMTIAVSLFLAAVFCMSAGLAYKALSSLTWESFESKKWLGTRDHCIINVTMLLVCLAISIAAIGIAILVFSGALA